MMTMHFTVAGRPVAQPRHRAGKHPKTGKAQMCLPKKNPVHAYRDAVALRAREARPSGWPMDAVMRVVLEFVIADSDDPYICREDADNFSKAACDGMKGNAYEDDRQVVALVAYKRKCDPGESPCTLVTVTATPLGEEDAAEPAPAP